MRSVRIPRPLHSSELSRTRRGSSPKSSSYRPRPLIVLVLELVLVLVFFFWGLHGRTRPRGTLNGAFLRSKPLLAATSKIEDEDEFEDDYDHGE